MFVSELIDSSKFLRRLSSGICAALGLFFVTLFSTDLLAGPRAGVGSKPKAGMVRIDSEEGAKRLAAFRSQRLQGDFAFEFQLVNKPASGPKRGRSIRYKGSMWGTWNEMGPLSRFIIYYPTDTVLMDLDGDGLVQVEFITQNGLEPKAWIRREGRSDFLKLSTEAMSKPLIPGIVYTPFDLLMPFIYWSDFEYEGPRLNGLSRVAQQFKMLPSEGSEAQSRGISAVRIGLDDTYDALLRVEVLKGDEAVSRFSVDSFQKVQNQHIVRQITLVDNESRDATSFRVMGAKVGFELDPAIFNAEFSLDAPEIDESEFEWFSGSRR